MIGKGCTEVISKKDLDGRRNEVTGLPDQGHCTPTTPGHIQSHAETLFTLGGVPSLVFENKVFIPNNLVRFGFSLLEAKH